MRANLFILLESLGRHECPEDEELAAAYVKLRAVQEEIDRLGSNLTGDKEVVILRQPGAAETAERLFFQPSHLGWQQILR